MADDNVKPKRSPKRSSQATSLAIAFAKRMATPSGKRVAPQEVVDKRLAICVRCKDYSMGMCAGCGCSVNAKESIKNKLTWATEKCPKGFWSEHDPDKETQEGNGPEQPSPEGEQ